MVPEPAVPDNAYTQRRADWSSTYENMYVYMQYLCICVYLYMFVCVYVYMYIAHVYKAPGGIPSPPLPTPQPAQPSAPHTAVLTQALQAPPLPQAPQVPTPQPAHPGVPAPHTTVLSQALQAPPLPQAGPSVPQAAPNLTTALAPALKPPPLPQADTTGAPALVTPHCPALPQPTIGIRLNPIQPMGPDDAHAVLPAHAPPSPVGPTPPASPKFETPQKKPRIECDASSQGSENGNNPIHIVQGIQAWASL